MNGDLPVILNENTLMFHNKEITYHFSLFCFLFVLSVLKGCASHGLPYLFRYKMGFPLSLMTTNNYPNVLKYWDT